MVVPNTSAMEECIKASEAKQKYMMRSHNSGTLHNVAMVPLTWHKSMAMCKYNQW